MRVHENMKRLRERMALSQAAFAKLIGVEEADVIAIENGVKDIPVSLVYAVAEKAGATASWLMDGSESASYSGKYDAVLRIYNKQDRAQVAGILLMNGYDVGQHKAERTKTGKTMDYFIHAKLMEENADTSR